MLGLLCGTLTVILRGILQLSDNVSDLMDARLDLLTEILIFLHRHCIQCRYIRRLSPFEVLFDIEMSHSVMLLCFLTGQIRLLLDFIERRSGPNKCEPGRFVTVFSLLRDCVVCELLLHSFVLRMFALR